MNRGDCRLGHRLMDVYCSQHRVQFACAAGSGHKPWRWPPPEPLGLQLSGRDTLVAPGDCPSRDQLVDHLEGQSWRTRGSCVWAW